MTDLGLVEAAAPLGQQPAWPLAVLKTCNRRLEVARVGETVGADRAAVGQRELGAVVLADIAARGRTGELDLENHAARHDADLAWLDTDGAHFGDNDKAAL